MELPERHVALLRNAETNAPPAPPAAGGALPVRYTVACNVHSLLLLKSATKDSSQHAAGEIAQRLADDWRCRLLRVLPELP